METMLLAVTLILDYVVLLHGVFVLEDRWLMSMEKLALMDQNVVSIYIKYEVIKFKINKSRDQSLLQKVKN